jgi:hypothetical protein
MVPFAAQLVGQQVKLSALDGTSEVDVLTVDKTGVNVSRALTVKGNAAVKALNLLDINSSPFGVIEYGHYGMVKYRTPPDWGPANNPRLSHDFHVANVMVARVGYAGVDVTGTLNVSGNVQPMSLNFRDGNGSAFAWVRNGLGGLTYNVAPADEVFYRTHPPYPGHVFNVHNKTVASFVESGLDVTGNVTVAGSVGAAGGLVGTYRNVKGHNSLTIVAGAGAFENNQPVIDVQYTNNGGLQPVAYYATAADNQNTLFFPSHSMFCAHVGKAVTNRRAFSVIRGGNSAPGQVKIDKSEVTMACIGADGLGYFTSLAVARAATLSGATTVSNTLDVTGAVTTTGNLTSRRLCFLPGGSPGNSAGWPGSSIESSPARVLFSGAMGQSIVYTVPPPIITVFFSDDTI